jgi:two-component system nitrogen regulation response regulator NtrX
MAGGKTVLIVEPVPAVRDTKARILEREGYTVASVESAGAALKLLARPGVALVLLDLPEDRAHWGPLDTVTGRHPEIPVVVMQAHGELEDAVEAMRRGAADYLAKSLDPAQLLRSVDRAIRDRRADSVASTGLIERSPAMHGLMDQVRQVAPSNANVLLCGESGVGKEVVARYIHAASRRRHRDFVAINCASLSDEILENELFGHERGAFTGANETKTGVFEVADGGTLFLDEVGEMGLRCQAKLLRVIERKEFRRVGGTRKIQVDVRLIAATNTDVHEAVAARRFRKDLYYRLNVITFRIPPLRERVEVIPDMIDQFLREFGRQTGRRIREVGPEALAKLVVYEWPGNVRELRNVVESLALTAPGPRIELRDLPATIRETPARQEVRFAVGVSWSEIERQVLRDYMEAYGTKKEAARALDIPLRTFHAKAKRYGLAGRRRRPSPADAGSAASPVASEHRVRERHSRRGRVRP